MRKEYLLLFNAMTDLLAELQALQLAIIRTQQQAEELYLEGEE